MFHVTCMDLGHFSYTLQACYKRTTIPHPRNKNHTQIPLLVSRLILVVAEATVMVIVPLYEILSIA